MKRKDIIENLTVDTLLNSLSESYVLLDTDGRIQFFNTAATRLKYFIAGSLALQRPILEAIPLSRTYDVERELHLIVEDRKTLIREVEFTNEDNDYHCVEITYNFVPGDGDSEDLISWEGRDLTRQKIFERKLAKIANDTSNLLEQANAVIFAIDARGYITQWNRRCFETMGFKKDEVYTKRLIDILIDEDMAGFVTDDLVQVLVDKTPLTNMELPVTGKDGKRLTLLLSVTPRISANGMVVGATLVGQDITERIAHRISLEQMVSERTSDLKKALEKEKELLKVKDRFVSVASHEFRTPLSSIKFSNGYVRRFWEKLTKEQLLQKFDAIDKQVHHMLDLLDDVLTIGKVDSGRIKSEHTSVDVNCFFESIHEEIGHQTGNTHRIHYRNSHPELRISSDEKLLRNIFINLITNAIKFSPGQDGVYVDVTTEPGALAVLVHDKGIGIEPGDLENIFDPFHRAGNVNDISGTGLGLSIAKKAAELLNGCIDVESRLGEGTSFKVTLKLNEFE